MASNPYALHRRNENSKALDTNQIIAIVGVFASVFGTLLAYEVIDRVRRCIRARRERRAREVPDEEASIESAGVRRANSTVVNNYYNFHNPTSPQRPWPVPAPMNPDPMMTGRSPGLFSTQSATWPGSDAITIDLRPFPENSPRESGEPVVTLEQQFV